MHLNVNRARGHGRSRSEDINVNALNEALKARDEAKKDKKLQRKSDRKNSKASELTPTSSDLIAPNNISINNNNTNNKLGFSSDEIGPMSLPAITQEGGDDATSDLSDGSNFGQAAHRTKSANIKIDLKAARRGDNLSKSPRRRMMQSGPISPPKGLAVSSDQVDNIVLPKTVEQGKIRIRITLPRC